MKKQLAKRALCTFSAISILFATGCANNDKPTISQSTSQSTIQEVVKSQGDLRIALSESEGVNPYLSNTNLTHQASALTFTNMVDISPTMEAVPKGVSRIVNSGLTVTLIPNSTLAYADGSAVSSADIAACINAAKQSEAFSAQLVNVEGIQDTDTSVILTLTAPDSLFEYLLNLPVIKAQEVMQLFPTSSGRYSAAPDGFTLNDDNSSMPKTIEAVPLTGLDEIVSALGVGELSLYYTEAENSSSSGTTSLQSLCKLNNLVFLGLNGTKGDTLLEAAEGRIVVSEMLDRQILADKCYYQRAYPALGAINSFYPCVATKQIISANAGIEAAHSRMLELGYVKNTLDGYFEKNEKRCELTLLVYSESTYKRYAANLIKDTLSQNGIYVTIDETDNFDVYKQKIAMGEFDMYIGEVKLYNNMDLSVLLQSTDKASRFAISEELLAAYTAMRENANNAVAFEEVFAGQMPYIPLLWRMGTLVTSKNFGGITPTLTNIFYDMSSFTFF